MEGGEKHSKNNGTSVERKRLILKQRVVYTWKCKLYPKI